MRELVNFLRILKNKLDLIIADAPYEIVFVMGNVSCDMDSVLSSILLAYMKNLESKSLEYTSQNETTFTNYAKTNKLYIPVINCPKGELFWRLDIAELFWYLDLEENDLFHYEEIADQVKKVIKFNALETLSIFF